jgi:hypothetical protein
MCGIAGFLAKRDGVDVAATLTAMLAALRGRGPDSTGMSLYGAPFPGDLVASAWAGEAGGEATRAAVSDGVSEAGFELSDQQYRDGYWRLGLARNGGDGDVAALADASDARPACGCSRSAPRWSCSSTRPTPASWRSGSACWARPTATPSATPGWRPSHAST